MLLLKEKHGSPSSAVFKLFKASPRTGFLPRSPFGHFLVKHRILLVAQMSQEGGNLVLFCNGQRLDLF